MSSFDNKLINTYKTMFGLTNVDNTSDVNKPISNATQTALNSKLNLTGGTLTGVLTGTTANFSNIVGATGSYSGLVNFNGGITGTTAYFSGLIIDSHNIIFNKLPTISAGISGANENNDSIATTRFVNDKIKGITGSSSEVVILSTYTSEIDAFFNGVNQGNQYIKNSTIYVVENKYRTVYKLAGNKTSSLSATPNVDITDAYLTYDTSPNTSYTALNSKNEWTVEAIFYTTQGTEQYIFDSRRSNPIINKGMVFGIYESKVSIWSEGDYTFNGGSSVQVCSGSTNISLNTWYHVAWVKYSSNSTTLTVFINGVIAGTIICGTNASSDSDWSAVTIGHIRGYFSYSYNFKGRIAGLKVSNVSLYTTNFTPPQTLTKYSNTSVIKGTNNTVLLLGPNYKEIIGNVTLTPNTGTIENYNEIVDMIIDPIAIIPTSIYGILWNNENCVFGLGTANRDGAGRYNRYDSLGLSLGRYHGVAFHMRTFPMSQIVTLPQNTPFRIIAAIKSFNDGGPDKVIEINSAHNFVGGIGPTVGTIGGYSGNGTSSRAPGNVTYTTTSWTSDRQYNLFFVQVDRNSSNLTCKFLDYPETVISSWTTPYQVTYDYSKYLFGVYVNGNCTCVHKGILLEINNTPTITPRDWLNYFDTQRYVL